MEGRKPSNYCSMFVQGPYVDMNSYPPTFQENPKPTGYLARCWQKLNNTMTNIFAGSSGVTWVNNPDTLQQIPVHCPQQMMYHNPDYLYLSQPEVENNGLFYAKEPLYNYQNYHNPIYHQSAPNAEYTGFYDSSMLKMKDSKPLNPEAEEYIPLQYQMSKVPLVDKNQRNTLLTSKSLSEDPVIIKDRIVENSSTMGSNANVDSERGLEDDSKLFTTSLDDEESFEEILEEEIRSDVPSSVEATIELHVIESLDFTNSTKDDDETTVIKQIEDYEESDCDETDNDEEMNSSREHNYSEYDLDEEYNFSDDDIIFGEPDDDCAERFESILDHSDSPSDEFDKSCDSVVFADSDDDDVDTPADKCKIKASILFSSLACVGSFALNCDDSDSESSDDEDDDEVDSCCDINVDDSWEFGGGLLACRLTSMYVSSPANEEVDHCALAMKERRDYLKQLNETWDREVIENVKDATPRKVSFDTRPPTVKKLVAWAYAYRMARKGVWETYATDRIRFKRRIEDLQPTLSIIFETSHRQGMYDKLYGKSNT